MEANVVIETKIEICAGFQQITYSKLKVTVTFPEIFPKSESIALIRFCEIPFLKV